MRGESNQRQERRIVAFFFKLPACMVLINLPLATYTLSHPNPLSPFSFLRVTHSFVLVCNKGYEKHFWALALVISNLFEHFLPFT